MKRSRRKYESLILLGLAAGAALGCGDAAVFAEYELAAASHGSDAPPEAGEGGDGWRPKSAVVSSSLATAAACGVCTGTPLPCGVYSPLICADQEGCSVKNGLCQGTPDSCSSIGYDLCFSQAGCTPVATDCPPLLNTPQPRIVGHAADGIFSLEWAVAGMGHSYRVDGGAWQSPDGDTSVALTDVAPGKREYEVRACSLGVDFDNVVSCKISGKVIAEVLTPIELGGLDLNAVCQEQTGDFTASAHLPVPRFSSFAAYQWTCLSKQGPSGIDMHRACALEYPLRDAYARVSDVDDAYSWSCITLNPDPCGFWLAECVQR